ncbi:MAG: hypothetical protein SynsKO_31700 [Synoicihabitans sp.]
MALGFINRGITIAAGFLAAVPGWATASDPVIGEAVARAHCVRCHDWVEPAALPQRSWNVLLRYMGLRMGVDEARLLTGLPTEERKLLEGRRDILNESGLLPTEAVVTPEEWEQLTVYFMAKAPERSLPQSAKSSPQDLRELFVESTSPYGPKAAVTTLVHIDEEHRQVLVGDARLERFTILDEDLGFVSSIPAKNSVWVRALPTSEGIYLLSIADLPGAGVGEKRGGLFYGLRSGEEYVTQGKALGGLYRPSDAVLADLDVDGQAELVVSSFGIDEGGVTIHRREPTSSRFVETAVVTILAEPGVVALGVHDFNADGLMDVAVLISDARERLSIFLNQGNLVFTERIIVRSHAAFGYVELKLRDVNQDGLMDLITVNGDNVDSDPYNTLKPYHGVRVYLAQSSLKFEEAFFYPLYGAYGVEAEDFDMDGDIDLAAIAFNPDFAANDPEHFVYLEQTEAMTFTPSRLAATRSGRWLTMDAGDWDGDGDKDLVLGAGYVPAGLDIDHPEVLRRHVESGPALLLLENQTR